MRVYIRSSEEAMTFISVQLLISVFTVSFFIPLYINKYPPNCVYWVLYWVTKTQTLSLNSETSWGSPITSNINYGRTVIPEKFGVLYDCPSLLSQEFSYHGIEGAQLTTSCSWGGVSLGHTPLQNWLRGMPQEASGQ